LWHYIHFFEAESSGKIICLANDFFSADRIEDFREERSSRDWGL